ncbi:MAG: hypothetical protein ACFFFB_26535 [Candidatus Heimdallarchaeota archaeon]
MLLKIPLWSPSMSNMLVNVISAQPPSNGLAFGRISANSLIFLSNLEFISKSFLS